MDLPSSGFVGLISGGSEVAGGGYARQEAILAKSADGTYAANVEAIVWPIAYPTGWGLIDRVTLYNQAGELVSFAVPVTTVTVDAYEAPRIRPGGLVLTIGPSTGTPYGRRRYGMGRYATEPSLLAWVELLEIGFDRTDPCIPGVWAPATACFEATWEAADMCSPGVWEALEAPMCVPWGTLDPCRPGTWEAAQKPLRRAA